LAASGAPSITKVWPLPVSAKKPMPERVPVAPVQVTVQTMWVILHKLKINTHPQKTP
jgi:hypothetical protein